MIKYTNFFGLILLFSGVVFCESVKKEESIDTLNTADSFVIKKKKKRVSKSKMQEEICRNFGNQMACVPDVHQKIAELQKVLLDQTCKYLENSKEGVILKNNKNKLQDMLKVSQDFEQKLQEFCKDCDAYVKYLQSLT
ncbi:hypothetical protein ACFLYU_00740 [Candidatus Dependentiae bacterium]